MAGNLGQGTHWPIANGNNNLINYYPYSIFIIEEQESAEVLPPVTSLTVLKTESVKFFKNMGLLRKSRNCIHCKNIMTWHLSQSIVDMFEWICPECKKVSSIREGSILDTIPCGIEDILEVLGSWCNNEEIDRTADRLGLRTSTIMRIFAIAGLAAEKHIEDNISQWKIGGPGVIVLVETFPETHFSENKQNDRPILCLAELKDFPMTVAYHPLQTDSSKCQDMVQMKSNCQAIIRKFVHPNSAVVARRNNTICSFEDICANQPQISVVASNEGLLRHETIGRNLESILSTIWEKAVYDCMSAQYYPDHLVKGFLYSHMWKDRYGDDALPSIVEAIANFAPLFE